MVKNPHIFLVGADSYLSFLTDLLSDAGAKTFLCNNLAIQENGVNSLSQSMARITEVAIDELGYIDTLLFCDLMRKDETERPNADAIVDQTINTVSQLLVSVRSITLKIVETRAPGQIIVLCDTSAIAGRNNRVVHATVGGALVGMSKSLAKEFGRYNIAVNVISLGTVEGVNPQTRLSDGEIMMLKASGLGKQGSLLHLANNIIHLAKGEHWLNGQVLYMNDGLTM